MAVKGTPALLAAAVLALFLAAAPPSDAASGPTVFAGTSWNAERKVAEAPDGTLLATFTEAQGNSTGIAVKRSADRGASWEILPSPSVGQAFRSCVAVNSTGAVHLAWTQFVAGERQIFYGRWTGGPAWQGVEQLSDTPGYSGFPSLAVDSADRVHLVWYGYDGLTYQVYYRYLDGAGWHSTAQATRGVQDANNPAIAIGPDDRVHVAFYSYFRGETDVWYMRGGPAGFDVLERVSAPGALASQPSLVVHANGTAAVAYIAGANETLRVLVSERGSAGVWGAPFAASVPGEAPAAPSLVADRAGNLAVFFETSAGALRYRARIGGVWAEPITLATPPGNRWPSASWAAHAGGPNPQNVNVLWTQEANGTFSVGFARVDLFPATPCNCPPLAPWWQEWAVPLLFIGGAGASMGALWIAAARTKGGGRG